MQEIVLFLTGVAGAASAVAYRKIPKIARHAASKGVRAKLETIHIERSILEKSIARLLDEGNTINPVQRDRLLAKYQHQLGRILAKTERLESAKNHPDLGPLGDGLAALMDQRLGALDKRMHELASKMGPQIVPARQNPERKISKEAPVYAESGGRGSLELTTLTHIAKGASAPAILQSPTVQQPAPAQISAERPPTEQPPIHTVPPPTVRPTVLPPGPVQEPDASNADSDDADDIDIIQLKADIIKTVEKIEDSEVE